MHERGLPGTCLRRLEELHGMLQARDLLAYFLPGTTVQGSVQLSHAVEGGLLPGHRVDVLLLPEITHRLLLHATENVRVEFLALAAELGDDDVLHGVPDRLLDKDLLRLGDHQSGQDLEDVLGEVGSGLLRNGSRRGGFEHLEDARRLLEEFHGQFETLVLVQGLRGGYRGLEGGDVEEYGDLFERQGGERWKGAEWR